VDSLRGRAGLVFFYVEVAGWSDVGWDSKPDCVVVKSMMKTKVSSEMARL